MKRAFNDPADRKERERAFASLTPGQIAELPEARREELYWLIRDRNFGVYDRAAQECLRSARVCVAGQGCIGELAAVAAARVGFGTVRIVDEDRLELSNLNRNAYGRLSGVGRPKVENMAAWLADAAPGIRVEPFNEMIAVRNAERILEGCDVVIVGIDNMCARIVLHRAAKRLRVPIVTMSGAPRYRAFVSLFLPDSPDFETVFSYPTAGRSLDLPREELDRLHLELRDARARYSAAHGADPGWAELYLSGARKVWSLTPERVYITSTLCVREAVNVALGRRPMAVAPNLIRIDLDEPTDLVKVVRPPEGGVWNYEVW